MLDFLKDFWQYMKARKMYWLLPVIAVLLILGLLIVFVVVLPALLFIPCSSLMNPRQLAKDYQTVSVSCRAYCHWMVFYASNCIYCSTSHYGLVGQFFDDLLHFLPKLGWDLGMPWAIRCRIFC